jgi:hypothetical protein
MALSLASADVPGLLIVALYPRALGSLVSMMQALV